MKRFEDVYSQLGKMGSILNTGAAYHRLVWAKEEIRLTALPPKSGKILEAVLYRGELPRSDAAGVVGTGKRQARRIVPALLERGVLASDSPRAPIRLVFPATLAPRWIPGLFPERTGTVDLRAFPLMPNPRSMVAATVGA
jgi:hypothetical protein